MWLNEVGLFVEEEKQHHIQKANRHSYDNLINPLYATEERKLLS